MKTTTEELLAFVSVVDCGSITAAAERLEQTVSGVSRALTRLEKKLGVSLMHRTTRRLQLSEEGELFLIRARNILLAMDEAEEFIALRRQKPIGRLRVDTASPFLLHCVVPYMAEFAEMYPDIRLELSSNERTIDLLEQRVDVAIRIGALNDSTLHARSLGSSRLHVVASPDYLKKYGVPKTVNEIHNHRLLGFTSDFSPLNQWPFSHVGGETLSITPTMSASSGETLRQLALEGLGIACLSEFLIGPDVQKDRLSLVLPNEISHVRQPINAVYYRGTSLAGRIVCFLDFIAQRVKF